MTLRHPGDSNHHSSVHASIPRSPIPDPLSPIRPELGSVKVCSLVACLPDSGQGNLATCSTGVRATLHQATGIVVNLSVLLRTEK